MWVSRCPPHVALPPPSGLPGERQASCSPAPHVQGTVLEMAPTRLHTPAGGGSHHPSHCPGRLPPLSAGHHGASGPGPRSWWLSWPGSPQAVALGFAVSAVGVWPRPRIFRRELPLFLPLHASSPGSVSDRLWTHCESCPVGAVFSSEKWAWEQHLIPEVAVRAGCGGHWSPGHSAAVERYRHHSHRRSHAANAASHHCGSAACRGQRPRPCLARVGLWLPTLGVLFSKGVLCTLCCGAPQVTM